MIDQIISTIIWLLLARRLLLVDRGKEIVTALTALMIYNTHWYYLICMTIGALMSIGEVNFKSKIMMHTTNIRKETYESITAIGRGLAEVRAGFTDDNQRITMRLYKVIPDKKLVSDVSKGASRLRLLLDILGTKKFENVLELGVGAGGWLQVLRTACSFDAYVGYSRWNQPGQENFEYKAADDDKKVERHPKNIEHVMKSNKTEQEKAVINNPDLLLSDFGENIKYDGGIKYDEAHAVYLDDVATTMAVLDKIEPFIRNKPKHFIIRVPNIMSNDVISRLKEWQEFLGKGALVRLSVERNNVDVAYFMSMRKDNLEARAASIGEELLIRIEESLYDTENICTEASGIKTYGYLPEWDDIEEMPVKRLEPYDMTETIKAKGRLHAPLHTTKFLREIGWWPSKFTGSGGTQYNVLVMYLIKRIQDAMESFNQFQSTSTKPKDTYQTVLKKVDVAPKENHKYKKHMWATYKALAKHLIDQGIRLRKQTDEEMGENLNRAGAIGDQEKHLPYKNLGEYFDSGTWKPRVEAFSQSLKAGKPINADYNSIGKKERKKTSSSRLIWFQCATARLYEARLLGNIDKIVKKLPYSVSGAPLYDYGEMLARIFKKGRKAVADDVAGWDTKVSYSMLCMECEFLKLIAEDEEHRAEIERVYRMYAHPTVTITRDIGGVIQNVLYQLRGQVASGRRVTYSMNTITNIVVTLTRAAVSQGVELADMEEWVAQRLREGHSGKYGGKISGDDAVIIMDAKEAKLFATVGADFMNEIGMPRKNIADNAPSPVYRKLEDVDFCSHSFTQINIGGGKKRWMPTRDVGEIVAKATIFLGNLNSKEQQMAWARANALNMLINYFHMHTVRQLAMAILDCTPVNISLDDVSRGWSYKARPWLAHGKAVDIIRKCYANCDNPIPHIESIKSLPYASHTQLRKHDLSKNSAAWHDWNWELPKCVIAVRDSVDSSYKFDETGYLSKDVNLMSRFPQPFNWVYKKKTQKYK